MDDSMFKERRNEGNSTEPKKLEKRGIGEYFQILVNVPVSISLSCIFLVLNFKALFFFSEEESHYEPLSSNNPPVSLAAELQTCPKSSKFSI